MLKKRIQVAIVFWMIVVLAAVPAWQFAAAQDVPIETPTGEVIVLPPDATLEPTPVPVPTPEVVTPPAPKDENTGIDWDKVLNFGLSLAVVFLALKQGKLIPPETVDAVLARVFGLVKEVTAKTETPLDDSLVGITEEVIRKWVQQEIAKQAAAVQVAKMSSLPN